MQPLTHRRTRGFTLTELAIVLGVVGVLAAGLWNLLSGANEQVRDESAASTHRQLADAVRTYLNSSAGQSYMTLNSVSAGNGGCAGANCGVSANFSLPLPTTNTSNANCRANASMSVDANLQAFCDYLPPGFASTTQNAYRQTYSIRILRDTTAAGTAPTTFSFMILANGAVIPDTSGARIAALIGADGGFIYSAPTCTAAVSSTTVCGAFGGWTATTTGASPGFGFSAGASVVGSIASRTYASPQATSISFWLARQIMSGDSNYLLNTMNTPEYLGSHALVMGSYLGGTPDNTDTLYMGDFNSPLPATGGGAFNLQGGTINFTYPGYASTSTGVMNMQGGTVNMQNGRIQSTGTGQIQMTGNGSSQATSLVSTLMGCTMSQPGVGCQYAIQASDITVIGLVNANALYAGTFVYNSSDMRLKTDVHPIKNALNDIMRINPVSFKFKAGGEEGLGVIAQEIEKIYPQLVSDGKYKSVNYDGLIGPLIGAVQELKRQNDELRDELREQKDRQRKLEEEMAKFKP